MNEHLDDDTDRQDAVATNSHASPAPVLAGYDSDKVGRDDVVVQGDFSADLDDGGDDGEEPHVDSARDDQARPASKLDDRDVGDDQAGDLAVVVTPRRSVPDVDPSEDGDGREPAAVKCVEMEYQPGRLAQFLLKVLAIMVACGLPLFVVNNRLAMVVVSGSAPVGGSARIHELTASSLRLILSTLITFVKKTDKKETPIDAPGPLLQAILDGPNWPFRLLHRVVDTPTMLPDGTVIDRPGYHAGSGTYYSPDPTLNVPPMPEFPTLADAVAAVGRYMDLLVDVLVVAPSHLTGAVAALITPLVRSAIDGCVPVFVIDSAVSRIGKSELVNFVSILLTGLPAKVQPPSSDRELEKRVTMHVRDGDKVLAFDNGVKPLGGPVLEALVTARYWVGRILGATRQFVGRMEMTVYCTGNHVSYHNDMLGRVVIIMLGTKLERPGERPLQRPDAQAWLLQNRGQLIVDAITICRAYMAAGSPDQELTPMRGFDSWSRTVRSALVWAGLPDPQQELAQARADADPETEAQGIALQQLEQLFPNGAHFTVKSVHELLKRSSGDLGPREVVEPLADALEVFLGVKPMSLNPLKLGHAFKRLTNKTVVGLHMTSVGKGHAGVAYKIFRP